MTTPAIDPHEAVERLTLIHKELEIFADSLKKLTKDADPVISAPLNLIARRLEGLAAKTLEVHRGLGEHLAEQERQRRWRRLGKRLSPTIGQRWFTLIVTIFISLAIFANSGWELTDLGSLPGYLVLALGVWLFVWAKRKKP